MRPFWYGLAALSLFSGCVGDGDSAHDPLNIDAKLIPKQVSTLADWDSLSKEVRHDLVEGDYAKVNALSLTSRQQLAAVAAPAQKQLGATMVSFMRKNGDMTVSDPRHSRIGSTEVWVEFLLIGGSQVAAGRITFDQAGCDLPGEAVRTFTSEAAAKAAGCVGNNTNWSAYGSFNHDGTPFEYADFMSWSGSADDCTEDCRAVARPHQ